MKRPTVPAIISLVSREYGIRPKDITGRRRLGIISDARQIAMWLFRKVTGESLGSIGYRFNRDHGTVIHAVRSVENRREIYASYRQRTDKLLMEVKSMPDAA